MSLWPLGLLTDYAIPIQDIASFLSINDFLEFFSNW